MRATVATSLFALAGVIAHANAEAKAPNLELTDAELLAYTGKDTSRPIYLAIKGEIYDVSAKPRFYGPEGMYGHFAGRDGTRAWITECWGAPDQLTHRMDDIENMFMPRYLDEELEAFIDGKSDTAPNLGDVKLSDYEPSALKAALDRFGRVSAEEKAQRREADIVDAKASVTERVEHWRGFFANNPAYPRVGTVVGNGVNRDAPPPPPLCAKALNKQPVKKGYLDDLLSLASAKKGKTSAQGKDEL